MCIYIHIYIKLIEINGPVEGGEGRRRRKSVRSRAPTALRRTRQSQPATRQKSTFAPEREFCIDNLLVRIHFIIEMSLVDWPCAMGV